MKIPSHLFVLPTKLLTTYPVFELRVIPADIEELGKLKFSHSLPLMRAEQIGDTHKKGWVKLPTREDFCFIRQEQQDYALSLLATQSF